MFPATAQFCSLLNTDMRTQPVFHRSFQARGQQKPALLLSKIMSWLSNQFFLTEITEACIPIAT